MHAKQRQYKNIPADPGHKNCIMIRILGDNFNKDLETSSDLYLRQPPSSTIFLLQQIQLQFLLKPHGGRKIRISSWKTSMITLASIRTRAESIQNWTPENTRQTCLLRCEEANRFEEVVKARRKPTPVAQLGGGGGTKKQPGPLSNQTWGRNTAQKKKRLVPGPRRRICRKKQVAKSSRECTEIKYYATFAVKQAREKQDKQRTSYSLSLPLSPTPFLIADLYTSY